MHTKLSDSRPSQDMHFWCSQCSLSSRSIAYLLDFIARVLPFNFEVQKLLLCRKEWGFVHVLYFFGHFMLVSRPKSDFDEARSIISSVGSHLCVFISKNGRKFRLLCCMGSNVHRQKVGSLSFVCAAQHVSTTMVNVCSYQHKDFILTCLFNF